MKKKNIAETFDNMSKGGAVSTKPEQTIEAPAEKFSTTREVQPVADKIPQADGTGKEEYKPSKARFKSVVKQEVAAAVASGRDGGGGIIPTMSVGGTNHGSYSGNEGTIAGSTAGTPIVDSPTRNTSRFGKKLDVPARKINETIAEQVVIGFEESKPLSESKDLVQGYNGTYRNETVRLQKNQGAVPGSIKFARSLDEIFRDQLYFGHGQVVKQAISLAQPTTPRDYGDSPTKTIQKVNGVYSYTATNGSEFPYDAPRGNYVPRALNFTINTNNEISSFGFNVDDITAVEADSTIVNSAATHALTFVNATELQRQEIDSKAGDEQMSDWSPLARAIGQPSRTLAHLKDIEQDTGNVLALAYRKLSHSLSYQINKAHKDGSSPRRPYREFINSLVGQPAYSGTYEDNGNLATVGKDATAAIKSAAYRNGSPMLLLEMFDSADKYATKGDFLLQPRSFKMHVENAKKSLGIFRANPLFLKALGNMESFSTIGRDYDPSAPVCITDYATLASPLNWNDVYSFSSIGNGQPVFAANKGPYGYLYSDVRNKYATVSAHPLLKGLHKFLSVFATKMRKVVGGTGVLEFSIPITYSLTGLSTWSLLVLAAIQYIEEARIDSLREVLDYERVYGYPFTDLVKLSEVDLLSSANFTFTDIMEPLKVGRMLETTSVSWKMPEVFWGIDEKSQTGGQTFKYVLPWYFNEQQFSYASNGDATFEPLSAVMSWPSSRDGLRFDPLDSIYSLDERTVRLSLDRMVRPIIGYESALAASNNAVYKYDMTSDGLPAHVMTSSVFTIGSFLRTPREIGMFIVSPYGYSSPLAIGQSVEFTAAAWTAVKFNAITTPMYGETSYRAKYYFGAGLYNPSFSYTTNDRIGSVTDINVNRSMNFVQEWMIEFAARRSTVAIRAGLSGFDPGFVTSINDVFLASSSLLDSGTDNFIRAKSDFRPFFNGFTPTVGTQGQVQLTGDAFRVTSLQKYLWTRINKLPFAISPFDTGFEADTLGEDAINHDPFDILYMFNFAGFRASDFTEDIFNKSQMIDTHKLLYINDPFVIDSPIVK
jgi:hypothetical protein